MLRSDHRLDYVLTQHAREALAKRRIPVSWVENALMNPEACEADPIDPELEHRLSRVKEFGDRVIRVIVNTHKEPPHVVTVFFDRRRSIS